MGKGISIVFMGTPDFAVASLRKIWESGINIRGVITAPDKPAGRGKKLQSSAVKDFAQSNNIRPILQPTNLKDVDFQIELNALHADLYVVVAFRMLPEAVWSMPRLGTINLHASLLPQYRGAAPINWAIINGEKKTGVTTFFIEKEIDTGNIIRQEEIKIEPYDTAGSVHDKLMLTGAELLVETIECIDAGCYEVIPQKALLKSEIKHAPKIFKEECRIIWELPVKKIHNLIRGLSPYPAAWTEFHGEKGTSVTMKIFEATIDETQPDSKPGTIIYEKGVSLKISCTGGFIVIKSIQQAGKKRLDIAAFLRGVTEENRFNLAT